MPHITNHKKKKRKPLTHTLIFDIGKTNKKCFLFDETFQMIHQEYVRFEEILDDDGFPCDDLAAISKWILEVFERLMKDKNFDVRAVNFSTYGASFVHLDEPRNVLTPLYNYLKPYPEALSEKFYKKHGDELEIATATGSPNSGMLNAGFQLYWLKQKRIEIFQQIK